MMPIRTVLRALLVMALGALTLTLTVATPTPEANSSVVVHAYTYDGHHPAVSLTDTITERGPPAANVNLTAYNADGPWPLSALGCPDGVGARTSYNYDDIQRSVRIARGSQLVETPGRDGRARPVGIPRSSVAANAASRVDIAGARFAQKSYSEMFSSGGRFAGQSIDDVAGALRSGALSPKDVPIDVIARGGNSLILNTRSSQALIRAGIPRSAWNVVDRTGQAAYEARLTGQLTRNGLTSYGTELP
jgi:hypothetical protein